MTFTRNPIFFEDDEQLKTHCPFPPRPAVLFYVDHGQDGPWAGKSLTDRRHNICLPAPSNTFPFLSLPSEIRHEVYFHLFTRPRPITPFRPPYARVGNVIVSICILAFHSIFSLHVTRCMTKPLLSCMAGTPSDSQMKQ